MIKIKIFEDYDIFFEESFDNERELIVGRGSTCDIILAGHPGISRNHFKILIKNDFSVSIEIISKIGRLIYMGNNIANINFSAGTHTVSVPPYEFTFELPVQEVQIQSVESLEIENKFSEKTPLDIEEDNSTLEETEKNLPLVSINFDEDEKTKTSISSSLKYSIKVFKNKKLLQELELEGSSWSFGRDQTCHYTIESNKTSRKHFIIANNHFNFFITDLGSSNGTLLNTQQLPPNQEIELKSGDYIEVVDFRFIFEIKDVSFHKKVKNIALIEPLGSEDHLENPKEIKNLRDNALTLSDEILKLPEKNRFLSISENSNKKKYLKPVLLSLILILGGVYFLQSNTPKIDAIELASIQEEQRLNKEHINAAIDKFNLALRFFQESQFEQCIFEIDEFIKYDVETEETSRALELKNQCSVQKDQMQRALDIEIQEKNRLALEQEIQKIITICRPQAQEGSAVLKLCVEPAFNLDPSNEEIQSLLDIAEAVDLKREEEAATHEKYQKRVARGRSLYQKAKNYDRYNDWKKALKAYNKHITSRYPDPSNLKKKAKRNVASINTRIKKTLSSSIEKSKKYLSDDDYKNVILSTNKGLEINRDHPQLLSIKAQASKNLKIILRKHYQEGIIQEDFGQIDEAKIMWKKILEQGVKGSDYYKKAKLKLKYYEEGV